MGQLTRTMLTKIGDMAIAAVAAEQQERPRQEVDDAWALDDEAKAYNAKEQAQQKHDLDVLLHPAEEAPALTAASAQIQAAMEKQDADLRAADRKKSREDDERVDSEEKNAL